MEAYAIHKGAMIAPRKARMTLDLIRGKDVETAQGILANTNTKASRLISKVLNSAIANAVNNNKMDASSLYVSQCFACPGPILKRIRPMSKGRAYRIEKRSSHVTIVLKEKN